MISYLKDGESRGKRWEGERPERRDATRDDRREFVFVCEYDLGNKKPDSFGAQYLS